MADPASKRFFRGLLGLLTLALLVLGALRVVAVLGSGPDADRFSLRVLFKDVQGLAVGSRVVHRGMVVGSVARLGLDRSADRVNVLLRLDRAVAARIATDSQIWVVRPRIGGIAVAPTGLDTLIKESYLRLRLGGSDERVREGDEILGLEAPPKDLAADELDDPQVGDLLATVVFPERHGLGPGSPVLFRGVQTGEVRGVRLSPEAKGVLMTFRVERAWRKTVREKSRFWVSRPILRGNLITGVMVDQLGSLLAPALAYDSREGEESSIAEDAAVFHGLVEPPVDVEDWEARRVAVVPDDVSRRIVRPVSPFVRVEYRAIEKDTFSANDEIHAQGEGVLYRNRRGALVCLTTRSACDARFLEESHWYDSLRIADERIRVLLADGRVWPARRVWIAPEDSDLALLAVQAPRGAGVLPAAQAYVSFDAEIGEQALKATEDRAPPFVIRDKDHAVGVCGHKPFERSERVIVAFALVPEALRPAR